MSTDATTATFITIRSRQCCQFRNGARAVEFYKSAFGAIEVYRIEDLGGSAGVGAAFKVNRTYCANPMRLSKSAKRGSPCKSAYDGMTLRKGSRPSRSA